MKRVLVVLVLVLASAASASAQTIFFVRHAERADTAPGEKIMAMSGADPDLSAAGHARAESLAQVLRDAKITAIYVTEYKRTRQTAEPLAKQLGIEPTVITSKETPALIEKLKAATGNVLVVGHSNGVPNAIKGLGITESVVIPETDFDSLFVVTPGAERRLIRLHYR